MNLGSALADVAWGLRIGETVSVAAASAVALQDMQLSRWSPIGEVHELLRAASWRAALSS